MAHGCIKKHLIATEIATRIEFVQGHGQLWQIPQPK
jgi:hypothetical protein